VLLDAVFHYISAVPRVPSVACAPSVPQNRPGDAELSHCIFTVSEVNQRN